MTPADPHLAIPQLIYRYCRALDRLDPVLLDAVFTPDADIDLGAIFRGPPAGFVPVMLGFMGSMAATRHEVANILLDVAGDRAGVESYVTAWHRLAGADGTHELIVRARYLSTAALVDGAWRLIAHGEVVDWGAVTPASAAWFDGNAELPKGTRDRGDPSYAVLP